ncbi:MAG: phenylalanine--tRNA ligase subunit beta [Pseudomonadales bacterium]|nr:phenylalanine--tRNA ligase subunit beta [Pseudomonadales bacterium]
MKFSEKWIREWVNPDIDSQQLVAQLTMAGLEVDGIESVAGKFEGVVVAEVVTKDAHPDADKLSLCKVSTGRQEYQVVCGAPNVRAGTTVVLAEVGAILPGNFKIKKAKLRGVESHGMLCSEKELELSDNHEGIIVLADDAPVGQDIRSYLDLNDNCIDIDLTPNRGDCLSIAGLARELGVLNKLPVAAVDIPAVAPSIDDCFPVVVDAPEGCPRYVGRVIRNINVNASAPLWMQERLRRSGLRSIDPVVDVTNYVMLELGQPMHAFDLERLQKGIRVRMAEPGEKLTLLDGQEVALNAETLLIADESGPLAMAGIMGGINSGISEKTQNIFLESAFFAPLTIAGKARSYGLHTDSSHRFERGVDFQVQSRAIERATQLLMDIVGGEPGPVSEVSSDAHLPVPAVIELRKQRITSLLDLALPDHEIEGILTRLGMVIQTKNGEGWRVLVPSYRFDLSIEADLIEEIARVYGYNLIPVKLPQVSLKSRPKSEAVTSLSQMRRLLLARGYFEAITYSFVDPKLQAQFDHSDQGITLANPISADMSVMRTSLWPGLIQALQYNQNRQQERVRLFESGLVFRKSEKGIEQVAKLGGVIVGGQAPESWANAKAASDFYDAKGDVEAVLSLGGNIDSYEFIPSTDHALHPGQNAVIMREGEAVGRIGALHPSIEQALSIKGPVYLFEIELTKIELGVIAYFEPLSKFPEVRRDLSIIVDKSIQLLAIDKQVRQDAGESLVNLTLFDLYQGKGIDPDRKSLTLGLTWQHRSRTLTDDEISQLVDSIINNLEKQFNAELRG